MLPPTISPAFAQKILRAGKSINFLRSAPLHDPLWQSRRSRCHSIAFVFVQVHLQLYAAKRIAGIFTGAESLGNQASGIYICIKYSQLERSRVRMHWHGP